MSEDRATYRENKAGLYSELHSKIKLQAMDISCGKRNTNQIYGKKSTRHGQSLEQVPRVAVKSSFLEMFKSQPDKTLGSLI